MGHGIAERFYFTVCSFRCLLCKTEGFEGLAKVAVGSFRFEPLHIEIFEEV